jgi:xanthine dehydrogenase large subunit
MNKPVEAAIAAAQVGIGVPHESAHLHVAGAAPYTDDLPEAAGTLHCALGLSPLAHGVLRAIDLERLRAQADVVAVLTADDIPGRNDCGPLVHDDPILAGGPGATLRWRGQPVFAVVARTRQAARRAAALAREVIQADPLPPLLSARQAHAAGQHVLPPMHLVRGDAQAALTAAPHRLALSFAVGGQEHFYLEGQVALRLPRRGRRHERVVLHPAPERDAACGGARLASPPTRGAVVEMPPHGRRLRRQGIAVGAVRLRGRAGGGELQPPGQAAPRPRRRHPDHRAAPRLPLRLRRRPRRRGPPPRAARRHGRATRALADLSGPVMTRALCHFDNAYHLPARCPCPARAHEHAEQHRLPRLRRAAGRDPRSSG